MHTCIDPEAHAPSLPPSRSLLNKRCEEEGKKRGERGGGKG
jgi:hypothetical protein